MVGSSNGDVDYLSLAAGALSKQYQFQSPIVGVSSSNGFTAVTTADGRVLGLKYTNEVSWSFDEPAGYASTPTILNGDVFLTGLDQTVTAFTTPGVQIP